MLQELDLDWANWLVINWGAIFKIARSQLLEGDWWQKGRWHFLEGGCSYYIKKQVWNNWRLKKKQWTICRFKKGDGEKVGMVFLSFWMVGDGGSYLDVHCPIYNFNWETSAITYIWNIYGITLSNSCSTSSKTALLRSVSIPLPCEEPWVLIAIFLQVPLLCWTMSNFT